MTENTKCECNVTGKLEPGMASWYDAATERPFVNHAPGECRCTNELKLYERNGRQLVLCSCCHLGADRLLESPALTSEDRS